MRSESLGLKWQKGSAQGKQVGCDRTLQPAGGRESDDLLSPTPLHTPSGGHFESLAQTRYNRAEDSTLGNTS